MADTIQIVSWTLAQSCRLRAEEAIVDPGKALTATAKAKTYASFLRREWGGFGIVGDVCVTSHTSAKMPPDMPGGAEYPCSGFVISEAFRSVGGAEGLVAMCRDCPANTTRNQPAGCCDRLYKSPWAEETEDQLQRIISRLGLEPEWRATFLPTEPLWFGVWSEPVLSLPALRLLRTVMTEIYDEDFAGLTEENERWTRSSLAELRRFIDATEIAEQMGLLMYVKMAPPGHTDFGYYTIFPHCPRCKAEAEVERWKRKYPTALYSCPVCGMQYSPAGHSSSEKDDFGFGPDLRELLGRERFVAFARECLIKSGHTLADADQIVAASELAERQREAKMVEIRNKQRQNRRWVRSVLMAGLNVIHRDADDTGEIDLEDRTDWLDGNDFAIFLEHCKERRLRILCMFHHSESDEFSRYWSGGWTSAQKVLAKWRKEGCKELFSASVEVPDELLDGLS